MVWTPWVQMLAAPPFIPALSHFQRSTDVMAQLVSQLDLGALTIEVHRCDIAH